MSNFIKWIGGGIGWAAGGPIGAIIGFLLGAFIDGIQSSSVEYKPHESGRFTRPQTTKEDFYISLLILSSVVMKADSRLLRSELNYIKEFLVRQFGKAETERLLPILKKILNQDVNVTQVANQIKMYMEYQSRLQLMHYLFGIANADKHVNGSELNILIVIHRALGITQKDFDSLKAMFVKDVKNSYAILEITPSATNDEVKKAYRKMATKYHPDKVAHLGEEVQKAAKEKFQELNSAYENIKKERGIN